MTRKHYPRYVIQRNRETGEWPVYLAITDWQGVYHHRLGKFREHETALAFVTDLLPDPDGLLRARLRASIERLDA